MGKASRGGNQYPGGRTSATSAVVDWDSGREPAVKSRMCRSIKVLRQPDQRATVDDFNAAALQFVRKISGFRKPSKANQESFERAVAEVAEASRKLLESIDQAR